MTKLHLSSIVLALSISMVATAQNSKAILHEHPELSAGFYHSYDVHCSDSLAPSRPEGYEPFYISHYGRHGSRWHTSEKKYKPVLDILEKAYAEDALTQQGENLLEKIRIIAKDAQNRYGELSPRGELEHKAIAERMFWTYPEVFSTKDGHKPRIDSKSTIVIRCILSMAANNERLKELNPDMIMTRESSRRNMWYMSNRHLSDSLQLFNKAGIINDSLMVRWIKPKRFIKNVFSSRSFVKKEIPNPHEWMYDVFLIAGIMESSDHLGIDLFDYFTEDELYDLWRCINVYGYITMGPSLKYGDANLEDAKPLLRNIIETADKVVYQGEDISASLRFGHDSNIIPLLSLIGVENVAVRVSIEEAQKYWNLSKVSPMATNLQFIFFKPEGKTESDDIKVRVLYNERDAKLPLENAPFYEWEDLKTYLESRLALKTSFN